MEIRKANLADARACAKLRASEDKGNAIDFARSAKDKHCIFLVAKDNGTVCGYCIGFIVPTQGKESMLHETRVSKSFRGSGVGTALVKAYCKAAFRRGARDIYTLIEQKHARFYCESCGFKKNNRWIELKKSK